MESGKADGGSPRGDELLFRLRGKRSLGLRAATPIAELLDPVRHRAGDCGCGEVGRDELIAALLVAAARGSDEDLREAITAYRQTRLREIGLSDQPLEPGTGVRRDD